MSTLSWLSSLCFTNTLILYHVFVKQCVITRLLTNVMTLWRGEAPDQASDPGCAILMILLRTRAPCNPLTHHSIFTTFPPFYSLPSLSPLSHFLSLRMTSSSVCLLSVGLYVSSWLCSSSCWGECWPVEPSSLTVGWERLTSEARRSEATFEPKQRYLMMWDWREREREGRSLGWDVSFLSD